MLRETSCAHNTFDRLLFQLTTKCIVFISSYFMRVARRRLMLKIFVFRRKCLQASRFQVKRHQGLQDLTEKYAETIAMILASEKRHASDKANLTAQHSAEIEAMNKKHAEDMQMFEEKLVVMYNEEIRVANHRRFAAEEALFRANLPKIR